MILAAAAGWILAALALGLWWGERGRRIDAQRAVGTLYTEPQGRATVTDPDPEAEARRLLTEAERARLVSMLTEGGAGLRDAEKEADRLLARAYGVTADGW